MRIISAAFLLAFAALPARAATITWTDPVLTANATKVRAVHIQELRTRTDAARVAVGLAAFAWTDPTLATNSTRIRVVHVVELRAAVTEVYTAASLPAPTWTDPVLTANVTKIRAIHIAELRLAVQNVPLPPSTVVNGACGPSAGSNPSSWPASGYCSAGTVSMLDSTAGNGTWSCVGSGGGSTAYCEVVNGGCCGVYVCGNGTYIWNGSKTRCVGCGVMAHIPC